MANAVATNVVKSTIERIERLEREKAEAEEAIKEAFAEARGNGLDVPILKTVLAKRRKDPAALAEAEALVTLYEEAAR